jgi:hypothetical protein
LRADKTQLSFRHDAIRPLTCVNKFSGMENPFKPEDRVATKVRGKEVEAIVTAIWKNEVQVRTPDNERRWRTIYTVWYRGGSPIPRPVKQPPVEKEPSGELGETSTAVTKKRKSKGSSKKQR